MTNEQLILGVGIPLTVFLISVFLSNRSLSAKLDALKYEVRSGFVAVNSRIDGVNSRIDGIDKKLIVIEGDLRTFHSITGNHEGRLSSLEG